MLQLKNDDADRDSKKNVYNSIYVYDIILLRGFFMNTKYFIYPLLLLIDEDLFKDQSSAF